MIRRAGYLFALTGLVAALALPAQSAPVPECPADPNLALLVADADVIVVGVPDVPVDRLAAGWWARQPDSVEVPVRVIEVLKGRAARGPAILFHYPHDRRYSPSNAALLAQSGTAAILHLSRGEPPEEKLFYAGHTPKALTPATDAARAAVTAEISRQQRILEMPQPTNLPHLAEVRRLIGRLGPGSSDKEQSIFDRLEALGEAAVAAIVARMDDRRRLRYAHIELTNKAVDRFEAFRQYSPERVVDALAHVLNQITGRSFGNIPSYGGTETQRRATIAGWRIYAADMHCRQ